MAEGMDSGEFALKKVDRSRRLVTGALVLHFLLILVAIGALLAHARVDDEVVRSKLLFIMAAAQMLFVGSCAGLLAVHVSRTAKMVLRAIELLDRK
jgi:hypothetical protein